VASPFLGNKEAFPGPWKKYMLPSSSDFTDTFENNTYLKIFNVALLGFNTRATQRRLTVML
jgi:hypothetical protein